MRSRGLAIVALLTVLLAGCGGPDDPAIADGAQADAAQSDGGPPDAFTGDPLGAACAAAATCASGNCADGVCCDTACTGGCEACVAAVTGGADGSCAPTLAGTDPDGECDATDVSTCGTSGACDGAGACARHPNGAVCAPPTCAAGVETLPWTCDGLGACKDNGTTGCAPYDCVGDVCATSCADDAVCMPGLYCDLVAGACVPVLAGGAACTAANQCGSGFCTDGVCCDAACGGSCEGCLAVATGLADGTCGFATGGLDPDGDCADAGAGTCGTNGACDGAGSCALYAAGAQCAAPFCAGIINHPPDLCDGAGTCVDSGTVNCGLYECVGSACTTMCATDSECSLSAWCSGTSCLLKSANGVACGGNNQCSSNFCIDGVCCNSGCAGTCQACTAAKKGAGADGACGSISGGSDPDNECATQAVVTCGTTGFCDGAAACAKYSAGTVCVGQSCSTGIQANADTCNGTGTCVDNGTTACTPYVCGPGACLGVCAGDSDCIAVDYCAATSCVPKKANGSTCAANNECTSTQCVDGVCCNTACLGTCQACNVPGSVGSCSNRPAGQADPPTCTGVQTCNGAGACVKANGVACALGSECLSGNCVDGVCCNSTCGTLCQACNVAGSIGACSNVPAGTDPAGECAGALTCNGAGTCF